PPAAPTARRPHPGRERSRRRPRSYGSSAWTPLMVLTYNSEVVLRNQMAAERRDRAMGQPVVHFEIIGNDPTRLRDFYGELFGWACDTSGPVARSVSQPGNYGFTEPGPGGGAPGIPGGVGGGPGYRPHIVFYVGVPDVEAALRRAESLGGQRAM